MQMSVFLADLSREIEEVVLDDKAPAPQDELKDDDIVAGVLPDDLKKLFVVLFRSDKELVGQCESTHERLEKMRAMSRDEVTPGHEAFAFQHFLAHQRVNLIGELFWHGVREAFPYISGVASIDLRKNWMVVTQKPALDCERCGGRGRCRDYLGHFPLRNALDLMLEDKGLDLTLE
jgi:hypothetical protein